ncbi:MAG: hypothetical protein NTU79_23270 [Planctomycetota bacterium]|nr:hypothetical protein [Planctomycetota bacterium]
MAKAADRNTLAYAYAAHPYCNVADELRRIATSGVHVFWETLRVMDFELSVGAMTESGRMILMAGRDGRPLFPVGRKPAPSEKKASFPERSF